MTEKALQAAVMEAAQRFGLKAHHTYDSRRSNPGFPDCEIVGTRIIHRELKVKGRKPTADQREWIDAINAAGGDAAVWRDTHWQDGRILDELAGLR